MKSSRFPLILIGLSLLVGALYLGPLLAIQKHLRESGQPFVLSFESYRNDVAYLTWAREIYDGHFPPSDPFSDAAGPMLQNPIPSLLLAGTIALAWGSVVAGYFLAVFIFSQINFLLFYWLGARLLKSRVWAISVALIAVVTRITLRILNFDGTA